MAKTKIPGGYIADNAITGDHIADNVITSAMLHTSFTVSSSNLSSIDTDNVSEGSTNLYYTDARARGAISVSGDLSYDSSTGEISFTNDAGDIESVVAGSGLIGGGTSGNVTLNIGAGTGITVNADDIAVNMSAFDTDNLSEGSSNLYFTNARVESYLDANGLTLPDNVIAQFGTGNDLQIQHTGSNSSIIHNGTGNLNIQNSTNDADLNFLNDDGSGGTTTYFKLDGNLGYSRALKDIRFDDDIKATFGNGNDLQIYHDGSNSYIQDAGTGNLYIEGTNLILRAADDSRYLQAVDGASGYTALYDPATDGQKLATTSTGIDVTGNIVVSGTVDGRDLATDGTKLDGIEANATADQTQSEINALGITATGLSGTPNITVGTLQATSFSDGTISGVTFIDEDSFATNSATRVPTQQSIKAYVDAQVAGVVDSAPAALNTLNELAAALGDDENFSTTTSDALGNRLRVDINNQGLTGTQQANAITNLGITATKAELNYVDGVTSSIQDQLDSKVNTTISSNADNRIITGSGTANTLNAESGLTYDGSGTLAVQSTSVEIELKGANSTANSSQIKFADNQSITPNYAGMGIRYNSDANTMTFRRFYDGSSAVDEEILTLTRDSKLATFAGAINTGTAFIGTGNTNNISHGALVINHATLPQILFDGGGDTNLDIAVPNGEVLQIGHWNTSTSSANLRLSMESGGTFSFEGNPIQGVGGLTVNGDISLPDGASTIDFGGSGQGGPHGLNFADDDGTTVFRALYRTSPNTLTFENAGETAKHTFDLDGNYTAVGTITSSSGTSSFNAADIAQIEIGDGGNSSATDASNIGSKANYLLLQRDEALPIEIWGSNIQSRKTHYFGGGDTDAEANIDTSGNFTTSGTINSGAITADTSEASSIPLTIGSSSSTNYTLQRWITSAHSGSSAYMIAYGASHASFANDFAMKNLVSGGDIYFQLANDVEPLRLTSTGATFAENVYIGTADTTNGTLTIHGGGTGNNEGGEIRLATAADHDGVYNFYRIDVNSDDLRFGREGETDLIIKNTGSIVIEKAADGLIFPNSHSDDKIRLYDGGSEKIGTASGQLILTGNTINFKKVGGLPDLAINGTTFLNSSIELTNIASISSGQLSATTSADATPAIIATNSGGIGSTIQRWVGDTDSLEVKNTAQGDYKISNSQQDNAIVFYDGTGGVEIFYSGSARQEWNSDGGTNLVSGSYKVGGTAVIDSNANLVNIGTINSGAITSSGTVTGTTLKADLTHDGFFGSASFSWGGSSQYPTLYSSHADRWVMMAFPHVTYLQNGTNGHTGSTTGATMRMAANASASASWDIGIGSTTDLFRIGREGSNALEINSSLNVRIGSSGTTPSSCKLHIGAINNSGSSAIAQFGGFIRVGGDIVAHSAAGTADSVAFGYTSGDIDLTVGEGSGANPDTRVNSLKIGTTTVIDTSRNLTDIGTYSGSGDMTISKNGTPTLTVATSQTSGEDALIKIRGARTSSSTSDIAKIQFDNKTTSAYTMAEIVARDPSGSHTLGRGSLIFRTSTGGTLADALLINRDKSATFYDNVVLSGGTLTVTGSTTTENALQTTNGRIQLGPHSSGAGLWLDRGDSAQRWFLGLNSLNDDLLRFWRSGNKWTLNASGDTSQGGSVSATDAYFSSTGSGNRFQFTSPTPTIRLIDANATSRYTEIGGENGSCNIAVDPGNAQGSSSFGVTIDGQQALYIDSDDRNYVNTSSNPTPTNATGHLNVLADLGDGVNIKHTVNGNNTINIWQTGTTQHSAIAFYKGNSQTFRGAIYANTGTGSTSIFIGAASDYRLKENVVPMSNATSRVMAMNPVQFDWIESGVTSEGFLAHELAEQCPDAVVGEKDAVYSNGDIKTQTVDHSRLTPLLVKTIQEQQALIESLQTRIEALEGE